MLKRPYKRHLTYVDDRTTEFGFDGWVMRGFESLEPRTGFGIAHDVLEHLDTRLGMDAEMQAFGSIIYGRVYHNLLNAQQVFPKAFVDDVTGFLRQGAEFCSDISVRSLTASDLEDHWWYEQCVEGFRNTLFEALIATDADYDGPICESREEALQRADSMAQWLRVGLIRVERRWAPAGGNCSFADCFQALVEHPLLQRAEVGQRATVIVYGGQRGIEVIEHEEW